MSWCDKLASTPLVGFKLDPMIISSDRYLDTLAPILNREFEGDTATFQIEEVTSTSIAFVNDAGFRYTFDPLRVTVGFHHRIRTRLVSGGPPTIDMLSRPLPYTELLPEVIERLIEATLLLPNARERGIRRLGIVSSTSVTEDELPPGIARLISYMGKPWAGGLESCTFTLAARLAERDGSYDKCSHTIVKPEDPTKLVSLTFDWMREFDEPQAANPASLNTMTASGQKAALEYFEELAEGSRFDEHVISGTT